MLRLLKSVRRAIHDEAEWTGPIFEEFKRAVIEKAKEMDEKAKLKPSEWNENLKEEWEEFMTDWYSEVPCLQSLPKYKVDNESEYKYMWHKEIIPPLPSFEISKNIQCLLPMLFYLQNRNAFALELLGKVIEHNSVDGKIAGLIKKVSYLNDFIAEDQKPGTLIIRSNANTVRRKLDVCFEDDDNKAQIVTINSIKLIRSIKWKRNDLVDGYEKVGKALKISDSLSGILLYENDSPVKIYEEGYKPVEIKSTSLAVAKDTFATTFSCEEFSN